MKKAKYDVRITTINIETLIVIGNDIYRPNPK